MTVYAVKAFLPIYGIAEGFNVLQVGIFFAVQELVHVMMNPLGGRLGDKFGYLLTIVAGMVVIAGAISYIPSAKHLVTLLTTASVIGLAQALIFPSTLAMISIRFTGQGIATDLIPGKNSFIKQNTVQSKAMGIQSSGCTGRTGTDNDNIIHFL